MRNPDRDNNFNLMRLAMALLVILSHSFPLIDGNSHREPMVKLFGGMAFGALAVDTFFLLSGYLIVQSWTDKPDAWKFLKKRLLRIYPAFIVASVISAFVVGPLASESTAYFNAFDLNAFFAGLFFLSVPSVPAVFSGTYYADINGSMWTIALEFCCYLLVLAVGASGLLRIKHFWLALTAAVFAALLWMKLTHADDIQILRLGSFFLSGGCYYIYRKHIPMIGMSAVAAAVFAIAAFFSWRAAELVLATVGGYAILYAATRITPGLRRFNRLPDVSYGVYLYGWPIQKLLLWYIPSLSPWELFAMAGPLSIIAGAISWYAIEHPAQQLGKASLPRPPLDARPTAL